MAYNAGILLGRIVKTSGFEGAVTVKLEKYFKENIPHMESVFIETEGRPVPFFIEDFSLHPGGTLKLKFENYDTDRSARRFIGCRVFATSASPVPESDNLPSALIGYKIMHKGNELLGSVSDATENNGQLLLKVVSPEGKQILVPLHEDFIVDSDPDNKILILELPEGLSDIN